MAMLSLPLLQIADKLDSGKHWSSPVISYSFPLTDPGYEYGGFSPFSTDQWEMAKMVLDLWADVTNITFVPAIDQSGQIRFFNSDELPLPGQAYFPGKDHGGDVHVNPKAVENSDTSFGGGALLTLLHEVGHALGLSHPGNYDADPDNPDNLPNYYQDAEYLEDSRQYTLMSYFDETWTGAQHYGEVASTPLLHDIYAIQEIYGTNLSTRAGDTVYGFNSTADRDVFDFTKNTNPVIAIWDGGGIDTLDLSGANNAVRLDLEAGAFSDLAGMTRNVAIAYNTWIENAIGGDGNDVIVGNLFDNVLRGGEGDDELYGEQHGYYYMVGQEDADELNGGAGDDLLVGGAGGDEIHGGSGVDRIYGHRKADVPDDWLYADTDYLYGGDGGDVIHGGFGDDWIYGDGGQDDDGGTNHDKPWTGDDFLFGEGGSDTIFGGDGKDTILGGDGVDYAYGDGGADTISGGNDDDTLYGDAGDDTLHGDGGNDELRGGADADDLWGSTGEDLLHGEDGDDWLDGGPDRDILHGGPGIDTASYLDETDSWTVDLVNGLAINEDASYDEMLVSIENLELGSGDDTAYGTNGANEIWGGAGNDTLEGRNGNDILHGDFPYGLAGVDTLRGGKGADLLDPGADNDFVYGGNGNDTLTYAWTEMGLDVRLAESKAWGEEIGTDLVQGVENAIGGAGRDKLYGDDEDNVLDGGDGNDTLAGLGGNDNLIGGGGADTLIPDWGNDILDGGIGSDTVDYSAMALDWIVNLSYFASADMPFIGEIEHTLIDIENAILGDGDDIVWGDNGNNTITGNGGDDRLYGGNGNDTLYGDKGDDTLNGGAGGDRLFGGSGSDLFGFYTGFQIDTVYDFENGIDRIDLSKMIGYDSFEDLTVQYNDGHLVILMGADSIVLVGTDAAVLDSGDFIWA